MGKEQEDRYYRWISQFPELSRQRLAHVQYQHQEAGRRHIVDSIYHSLVDPYMRRLHNLFIKLHTKRVFGYRQHHISQAKRAEEQLHDLHRAVQRVVDELNQGQG